MNAKLKLLAYCSILYLTFLGSIVLAQEPAGSGRFNLRLDETGIKFENKVVFTVRFFQKPNTIENLETVDGVGGYLLIDGVKHEFVISREFSGSSFTGMMSCREEFAVSNGVMFSKGVLLDGKNRVDFGNVEELIFGIEYVVNGVPIKLERSVSIVEFAEVK